MASMMTFLRRFFALQRYGLKIGLRLSRTDWFDADYYLRVEPDVRSAGIDPQLHFLNYGWAEGRNPSAIICTCDLVASNIERSAGTTRQFAGVLADYLDDGRQDLPRWGFELAHDERVPEALRRFATQYDVIEQSGMFDHDWYRQQVEAGIDPIGHFLRHGSRLGLTPRRDFDISWYVERYQDVRNSWLNPFVHYIRYGRREGRLASPPSAPASQLAFSTFPDDRELERIPGQIRAFDRRPLVSIVVPVYNTAPELLHACVRSVMASVYTEWELILVDDRSSSPLTLEALKEVSVLDARMRVIVRTENGNISAATNTGVAAASGEYIAFLDHDDEVLPNALFECVKFFNDHPDHMIVYTDQVKSDRYGHVTEHFFKPDWSPIYFLGVMYVGHLLVVKADLVEKVGGFLSRYDGVQDFEFLLRASEISPNVGHIPRVVYKWRAIEGSLAAGSGEKSGIDEKQVAAVQAALDRRGLSWAAEAHPHLPNRVVLVPTAATPRPSISIVIPSRDQGPIVERCLRSIRELTRYPQYEIIVVDNGTTDPIALAAFEEHSVRVVPFEKRFNFSKACNLGAAAASGDLLLFLNNDTEVLSGDWLERMAMFFEEEDVGAVGPMLTYPDGRVQHAGVVLGCRGTADHVMRLFQPDVDGYAGSLACSREVTAVTAACLLMRRSVFEQIGAFSVDYAKHYQDVDLCLKIRSRALRIVYAANTRVVHHESLTRKSEGYDLGDRALLIDRWHETIDAGDAYYNPALSIDRLDYSLR
ncbi:glycosyltransferase family 2 protein [Phreatobacter oligotrophus]|uniref:GT2 family glycosyltransferase n=1 Tax=Phreatobacter oligotrophus TaxID=1122261 RepID=A0A2T4YP36_9HYPH|nr:glycosyltransferase family 2 protein [Phreatobacter oligotrophus]PTM45283.1 GT2 family glycosyltransferase [Phreatobacter oligotrophus]